MLRALKDLELEHSVGKIDDDDYAEISARYREQAKGLLREMDIEIEPLRPKAEAIARTHLAKLGLAAGSAGPATADSKVAAARADAGAVASSGPQPARVPCPQCEASNEPDAAYCKKCRARLARVPCPSCATSNEPDATFCKKCGTSLDGSAAASEPTTEANGA